MALFPRIGGSLSANCWRYSGEIFKEINELFGTNHLIHDTRHTFISMCTKKSMNETVLKKIVGHANAQSLTERVYTHFAPSFLVEAIDVLD